MGKKRSEKLILNGERRGKNIQRQVTENLWRVRIRKSYIQKQALDQHWNCFEKQVLFRCWVATGKKGTCREITDAAKELLG